jgi:hypothetical protein
VRFVKGARERIDTMKHIYLSEAGTLEIEPEQLRAGAKGVPLRRPVAQFRVTS